MNPSSTPTAGSPDSATPKIEGLEVRELSEQDMVNILVERFGEEAANEEFFTLMAKENPEGFRDIYTKLLNDMAA